MPGETHLTVLLQSIRPLLHDDDYVICSIDPQQQDFTTLEPLCYFREAEGITLIMRREQADKGNLSYSSLFRMITLTVHSSLNAIGFLAAVAAKLSAAGISVNPVAAYYHDHLFVPAARAEEALALLQELARTAAK